MRASGVGVAVGVLVGMGVGVGEGPVVLVGWLATVDIDVGVAESSGRLQALKDSTSSPAMSRFRAMTIFIMEKREHVNA